MSTEAGNTDGFSKPTQSELRKLGRGEVDLFTAASVGRLGNLFPHWMLLFVETPLGIPSSRLIALWLLYSEESMTMGEIAQAIDLTPRGVTRIVDGLEADGLAVRHVNASDKRIKIVKLTAKGRRFIEKSFPQAAVEFGRLFSVLEKSEAIEFIRLLEKVTDQMKSHIDSR